MKNYIIQTWISIVITLILLWLYHALFHGTISQNSNFSGSASIDSKEQNLWTELKVEDQDSINQDGNLSIERDNTITEINYTEYADDYNIDLILTEE